VSLLGRLSLNLSDVSRFGAGVLKRHFARRNPDQLVTLAIPGVGPMKVRARGSDMEVARSVFINGSHAFPAAVIDRVTNRYRALVDAGHRPIIVDAGAYIGATALWYGAQFANARIVAIEPDPANAALLRRNLGGRTNCVIIESAIGSQGGFVQLQQQFAGWDVRTERAADGVPVVTMEDAFKASGGDAPFLVKINIEGFESDLFSSNTDWVGQCQVVVIEPHDWMLPGERPSGPFQQVMAQHPFELFVHGENLIYLRS
jgi:FkbM family methyltransferase